MFTYFGALATTCACLTTICNAREHKCYYSAFCQPWACRWREIGIAIHSFRFVLMKCLLADAAVDRIFRCVYTRRTLFTFVVNKWWHHSICPDKKMYTDVNSNIGICKLAFPITCDTRRVVVFECCSNTERTMPMTSFFIASRKELIAFK